MLTRFQNYIAVQHLVSVGDKVLLAVSGGRDSVCMAHLMHEAGFSFAIAHCNFNLRPVSCDRDQQFVASLASRLGVPFFVASFDTRHEAVASGESLEEAARRLRYEWFATLCRAHGFTVLATAHHRDDSIETFFLNLFRGTGISGLHGIRPRTEMPGFALIRPLLSFSRAEIDAYVREKGLCFVDDHTNYELVAQRNQIRLRLMPLLRELYPSVDATMAANINRFYDTEILYRSYVDQLRTEWLKPYSSRVPALPFEIRCVDMRSLQVSPLPLATFLFELLRPYGFNNTIVNDILSASAGVSGSLFFSPTHVAELHRGLLLIAPRTTPRPPALFCEEMMDVDIKNPPPGVLYFPLSSYHAPLSLRLWQAGDRFRPLGMKGQRLVSDFLKDLHLSRIEKAHTYLIVDDDDNILAVAGIRPDDRFRISLGARKVLRVEVKDYLLQV